MNSKTIDLDRLLDDFDNDKEVINELINDLLDNLDNHIKIIENGIQKNNSTEICKEAHKIKGGASNISALGIADAALKIEQAAKNSNLEECKNKINELKREIKNLKDVKI